MVRNMRSNSVMDDPAPFQPPEIKDPPKQKKVPKSEQERIKNDPKYPQLAAKLAIMREKHRLVLPDGTFVEKSDRTMEQKGIDWTVACAVLADLDELDQWLQANLNMVKISG